MKKIICGNWKMNKNRQEAIDLVSEIEANLPETENEVVVFPPFPYLEAVKNAAKKLKVGAQNCFWEEKGAFTGEVSPRQVKEFADYVLVGHSERRGYLNETNNMINQKIKAAIDVNLTPILCVGENLAQRDSGETEAILTEKILEGLKGLGKEYLGKIIIAYEPIWSISTTQNRKDCTAIDADDASKLIKKIVKDKFLEAGEIKVFFGGNINPQNAQAYLTSKEYDGGLVGGASLDANSFLEVIRQAEPI